MFRLRVQNNKDAGLEREGQVNDIHVTLLQKELFENCESETSEPVLNPIRRHQVTKEYRTKMADWMVEVCTSFKCSKRTYFLSQQIFDHYLAKIATTGKVLVNKEVHPIGCTAMYLASKYEDIYPLHSKVVTEKIAHKAISVADLQSRELHFLDLFRYDIDFVSHWDFWQTYSDKFRFALKNRNKRNDRMMKLLTDTALLLVKMAVQNNDFCQYSQSIIVLSCFYAATSLLKHSKNHECPETTAFCSDIRKIIA